MQQLPFDSYGCRTTHAAPLMPVRTSSAPAPLQLQPGLTIAAPQLGAVLWSLFLSADGPTPEARKAWLAAVAKLGA